MSRIPLILLGVAGAITLGAACSATSDHVFGDGEGGAGGAATVGMGGSGSTSTTGIGGGFATGAQSSGTGSSSCTTDSSVDDDGDGFTEDAGDCNDCDANVNPGAIEVVVTDPLMDGGLPEPSDEDCDGMVDNPPPATCDDALLLDDLDPMHAAQAVDLCKVAQGLNDWGVVSAVYVRANGAPAAPSQQFGILDSFGPNVNPQGGTRMLGLSSGRARIPGQAGACGNYSCSGAGAGTAPPGFPQDVPNCPGLTNINDDIALEVQLRAPTNATGYRFNFRFYSFEYPEWVCTSYNDQFIALVSPPPTGSINGNISFDSQTNPVSVNVAFFDVCPGCPLGTADLAGTGFDGSWADDAGATSWLLTTAPVTGGETLSIRFAIWDTGDDAWDSTALVDGFEWIANGGTVVVGTTPDPEPR